jgi:hypothetical protein
MMGAANPEELLQHLMQADEFGVKLEVVGEDYVWEFFPSPLHQGIVKKIDRSVRPCPVGRGGCGCFTLMDAYIDFGRGSVKRPDIAIYCTEPPLTRQALRIIPDAVVEVVSPGTEKKDIDMGPLFYLAAGIKDVVVVNPDTATVYHFRRDGTVRHQTPCTISLECGCDLDA